MTDKKEHIINKAMELFALKGFEGTSIRDLATAADVNVAMVNYYFGTKEKLFESMVAAKAAATRLTLDEIVQDGSLSPLGKINRIIDTYVSKLFTNRQFHRVIHQELMLSKREVLQNVIVDLLFPNSAIIRGVIEDGIKKGEFKKVDPELTVASFQGTLNQILLSKKFCNKFINREPDYIPYDDPIFRKRVIDHIKQLMANHLVKQ